jgi:uncharacterized membrane protein
MTPPFSHAPPSITRGQWIDRILIALASGGFVLFSLQLLYSAFCAFSWQNFLMMDYGAYTNFLYNLAHGDGFRFLTDHNYLKTHLSFSFILLTPLVHLWDSPLLLIVVQWTFLMSGCGILWKALYRGKVSPALSMAILFCFVAYPMTQSVMMSEFHGVSAYFLLIPWLFYTAAYQKRWAILPVLLTLGLREDAGLLLLPLLLYFSVRDRWRNGFILAVVSFVYVILAMTVLYPWINGVSLLGVRGAEASSGSIFQSFLGGHWECRWQAAAWLLLPSAVMGLILRNGWRVFVIFPSTAFLITLSSAMHRQHSFDFHYPAAVTTALVCAMVWVASVRRRRPRKVSTLRLQQMAAAALILVTVVAHAQRGYFLGGGKTNRVYARIHPMVYSLLRLEEETPKDGLLLCNQRLASCFAQRPEIMVLHYFDPETYSPAYILTDIHELQTPAFAGVIASLESGEFGLFAQDLPFVSLKRNFSSPDTARLLDRLKQKEMLPALMLSQAGTVIDDPAHGLLKQWDGTRGPQRPLLAFGRAIELPAGDYIAHFDIQAPERERHGGRLSVHLRNEEEPLASAAIEPTPADSFADQALPFHLSRPATVESRIQCAESPLQARSIRIQRVLTPAAD